MTTTKPIWAQWLTKTSLGLFLIGFASRIAPLFDHGGRLFRQYPTEDGYLMLTIARNLALGRGMSTAAGALPTNGTQPLFNLIQASVFWVTDGERESGVRAILLLEVVIAGITALLIGKLTLAALDQHRHRRTIALFASALWFASSVLVRHTMNCLETGLYLALSAGSALAWYRYFCLSRQEKKLWHLLGIGSLFGLTFLARIDAVFLIASLTGWHVLFRMKHGKRDLIQHAAQSTTMGLTSIVVGSPWLINNWVKFGSLMPISGTAQAYGASFGSNFREVPFKLFEYATLLVPIPEIWEATDLALGFASICVVGYIYLAVLAYRHAQQRARLLFIPALTICLALIAYYGLFFGAGHFVSRYLAPLSLWTAILTATLACSLLERFPPHWQKGTTLVAGLGSLGLAGALNARWYINGTEHMHFQVVEWVDRNVPEDTWVGAIQTGTLGFFHDRTVNLDGKVNPEALAAKLKRRIPEYVAHERFGPQQRPIEFLVDWVGIVTWMQHPPVRCRFRVLLEDREANLAVLERTESQVTLCE